MMKLRCLVSLQRVAGWMGISTEDEADLDKEIRATAGEILKLSQIVFSKELRDPYTLTQTLHPI